MPTINIPSPDFQELKGSLKDFLKNKPELSDYDFEGSTLSTIVDLLAYNSTFAAFYLNQAANDAFLHRAIRRDAVVARAQELGYTPKSAKSAVAVVDLAFKLSDTATVVPPSIVLTPWTNFVASAWGNTFSFKNIELVTAYYNSGTGLFEASNVRLAEGKTLSHRFTVTEDIIVNGLTLPNQNIDTEYTKVYVDDILYTKANNIVEDVDPESLIYFVGEDDGGLIRIRFGDDILGKKLLLNQIVTVEYNVSSGEIANGIGVFTLTELPIDVDYCTVTVLSPSNGGKEQESMESIKFNAPKFYGAQGRAVTDSDYRTIILAKYPNVADIAVWGGDKNVPPKYGYVYVAVKPASGRWLTDKMKEDIKAVVRKYGVVTVEPIIQEPDYLFVTAQVDINYIKAQLTVSESNLVLQIKDAIETLADEYIRTFDSNLYYSLVSRTVDNSNTAIVSSSTAYTIAKRFYPELNRKYNVEQSFNNAILQGSFVSSTSTFNNIPNCFFSDLGSSTGKISIWNTNSSNVNSVLVKDFGDIDYSTGRFAIPGFIVQGLSQLDTLFDVQSNNYFVEFRAKPSTIDLYAGNDKIIDVVAVNVQLNQVAG